MYGSIAPPRICVDDGMCECCNDNIRWDRYTDIAIFYFFAWDNSCQTLNALLQSSTGKTETYDTRGF